MLTVPPVRLRSSWFTAAARLHCVTLRPADHSSRQIHAPRPTLNTVRPVSGSTRNKMPPFPKPNEEPPAHRMVYFPDMTTALPSESGEFRRVLWTGLHSQVVLMTVPVGGDIGEEACITSQCRLGQGEWVLTTAEADSHGGSNPHLHFRQRSCTGWRRGAGYQSRGHGRRACGDQAPVSQYWS